MNKDLNRILAEAMLQEFVKDAPGEWTLDTVPEKDRLKCYQLAFAAYKTLYDLGLIFDPQSLIINKKD